MHRLANVKAKIIDHYERASPYYYSLWGQHLHHGYWIRGNESKEVAQQTLVEHLANLAEIGPGWEILDIGCGFGASSLFLSEKYGARATGITISPVQVEMANLAARATGVDATFLLMDAEELRLSKQFDLLWSVESISHFLDVAQFFARASQLLKSGGTFALTDWFKREHLSAAEERKFIKPIEEGMLVGLHTMDDYAGYLEAAGLRIVRRERLTEQCAKTWDLCLDIIKDRRFWAVAAQNGVEFVKYLRAFRAMRAAFASGAFVYGLLVARAV